MKVKERLLYRKYNGRKPKEISTSKDSEIEIMVREEENKKVDAQVEVDAEAPEPVPHAVSPLKRMKMRLKKSLIHCL